MMFERSHSLEINFPDLLLIQFRIVTVVRRVLKINYDRRELMFDTLKSKLFSLQSIYSSSVFLSSLPNRTNPEVKVFLNKIKKDKEELERASKQQQEQQQQT
jgi:hypothetical protein